MTFDEAHRAECVARCEWCTKGFERERRNPYPFMSSAIHIVEHEEDWQTKSVHCTAPTLEQFAQETWERLEQAEDRIGKLEAALRWRPISEMHEDWGPCVLMNIYDPGYLEIGSNLDDDYNAALWTHFVPVPSLTHEEADKMKEVLAESVPAKGENLS